MKNMYGIIRILGNNIPYLHQSDQVYQNLLFTLQNEPSFKNCKKIWVLNRITNQKLKNIYIELLKKYNYEYLDIPFVQEEYNIVKKNGVSNSIAKNICSHTGIYNPRFVKFQQLLYYQNLYICNNYGARNYALDYGRSRFKWSFVLDGNNFFLKKDWLKITTIIENNPLRPDKKEVLYIIIPMIRILSNKECFLPNRLKKYEFSEPQIAFKNSSKLSFNTKIPYGASPKAELLRVLQYSGPWNKWKDNERVFGINDRPKVPIQYFSIPKVLRLQTDSNNSKANKNGVIRYVFRNLGLYLLCNQLDNIKNQDKLQEETS